MTTTLQGADRTYQVDFVGTNAKCRIEDASGLTYYEVAVRLGGSKPSATLARKVFHAALVDPPNVSLEEAGAILDDIGGTRVVLEAFRGLNDLVTGKTLPATSTPKQKRSTKRG